MKWEAMRSREEKEKEKEKGKGSIFGVGKDEAARSCPKVVLKGGVAENQSGFLFQQETVNRQKGF